MFDNMSSQLKFHFSQYNKVLNVLLFFILLLYNEYIFINKTIYKKIYKNKIKIFFLGIITLKLCYAVFKNVSMLQ